MGWPCPDTVSVTEAMLSSRHPVHFTQLPKDLSLSVGKVLQPLFWKVDFS
jgi:hypothetical protein